ncbi:MAG: bifunctional heptose 7-phosphate kinase/heptose 1-phosphate adenyltransferase [Phycisphaeraceae bacterium]|nr:bifunctional heptose 7-phosphate kinase/heptose 1-phosphate adenyltransferase [Phycisphaeraceae bacterium]
MSSLLDALARWKPFTAVVVGDFMLDQLTYGDAERLSPEAPVPILNVRRSEYRPGGAANVCLDLIALRARVLALGITGDDREADLLRSSLVAAGVDAEGLNTDTDRPTTLKQSLIGLAQHRHPQKMFRLDRESKAALSPDAERRLFERFQAALPSADVVLIEDYGKGVCTPDLCRRIIESARARGVEVLIDPASISDYSKYRGATTITPNRTEAARAGGGAAAGLSADAEPIAHERLARHLKTSLDLSAVVITLDRHGALLVDDQNRTHHVPTVAREVYDVTGAGDMVLAALAGARANGLGWYDSVRLANIAAGLEVEVFGVVPIPIERIQAEASRIERPSAGKVRTREQLVVEVEAARHDGRSIIFTNGCFDILHAGHLSLLHRAAELANESVAPSRAHKSAPAPSGLHPRGRQQGYLIVAVNSDDSVRRLKGGKDPTRPINNQFDRAELLGGLGCVDAVVIFDEDTPEDLIRAVRPDVLVKGGEYQNTVVPGATFVESTGGRVVLLPMIDGKSTTAVVQRMRSS